MEIALVGMPNCGKSTLFNALTGKHARTGNRAGVTVSLTKAKLRGARHITLTDLPGIYAPAAGSEDEALTHRTLQTDPPDLLLFVADGTQLSRALELLAALRVGRRAVLAVNMCDELEKAGTVLDTRKLSDILGLPVFAISARSGRGVPELAQYLKEIGESAPHARQDPAHTATSARQDPAHTATSARQDPLPANPFPARAKSRQSAKYPPIRGEFCRKEPHAGCAGCIFGHTPTGQNALSGAPAGQNADSGAPTKPDACSGAPANRSAIPGTCAGQGAETCAPTEKNALSGDRTGQKSAVGAPGGVALPALPPPPPRGRLQNAADRLFLIPWTGIPCLLLLLAATLFFSFGAPGALLSGKFSALLALPLSRLVFLLAGRLPPFFSAFLREGVLAGTLAVLDFAPRLFLLFLFLTVMEDSGYLARAGALAAPVLRFFGLSGDAAVPLLLGVGCSVPAVLSTRHIRDGATRRLSLLLLPFIPCSARLPVIAVLSALFFASPFAARVIPVLGGVLLFLLFAFALSRGSRPAPFVGELPRYRFPSVQNVLRVAARRTGHFLGKAGGVIPLAAAVLWLLSHITPHGAPTDATDLSLLAALSGKLSPLFAPLGFGNWQAVAALISGIAAKETVLSALAVFAGGDLGGLTGMFSPRGALSFLCFFATYTPCVATLGAIRREGGWRALWKCLFFSFSGAYALAFLVYHL